jgi:hypothetical protein
VVLAWLVYAWLCGSLVLRRHIRGRRAAALAACGMGLVAMAYFFMEFISPIHQSRVDNFRQWDRHENAGVSDSLKFPQATPEFTKNHPNPPNTR